MESGAEGGEKFTVTVTKAVTAPFPQHAHITVRAFTAHPSADPKTSINAPLATPPCATKKLTARMAA